MKKFLLFIISIVMIIPVVANASTYQINDDMSININEESWYVFTRDNIKDNEELDELGITYDYMNDIFNKNNIYLDAIYFYSADEWIELFVRATENNSIKNFTNYSNDDILDFSKQIAKKTDSTNYSVYENDYKFAYSNYYDKTAKYYIDEYFTVVNGHNYGVTVQKEKEISFAERQGIRDIVDTIKFNINPDLKEPEDDELTDEEFIGFIVGLVISGIFYLIRIIVAVVIIIKDSKKRKI